MQRFEQRRDRFELFDRMESPAVNLAFPLELPDFRPWCKVNGLPVFHVLLCAVLRAVHKLEHFRYRVFEGEVILIDRIVPSYTVMNVNHDLNFAQFEWSDDLREFVARSLAARDEAVNTTALSEKYRAMSPREAKNRVYITCIPWLAFTSIQHPAAALAAADIPSIAWGKIRDAGQGQIQLPFSVQAHHGFVDGYHINLLAEQIAAEITDTMGSGTLVSRS